MDDTSSVVTYDDILCLFQRFVELGALLGCLLAQGKCKILSSTCGVSPRQFLHPNHRFNLDTALTTFCGGPSGELLQAIRLLGYPLGNARLRQVLPPEGDIRFQRRHYRPQRWHLRPASSVHHL
ncbi:MAG: hypothetical protein ACREOZ_04535 [Gloeomargaritales cyanobacterium]